MAVPGFGELKASQEKRATQTEYNHLRLQQSSLNHYYKCIEGGSTYQQYTRKYVLKAVPRPSFDFEPHASDPKNILDSVKKLLVAFYWFCYPYSMIGQSLWISWIVGSWPLIWNIGLCSLIWTAYSINDVPDIEGDKAFGIHSISARLGQKWVKFSSQHFSRIGCALLCIP
ncbi:hypothetical protein JHK85_006391 [Glycine max]|nr:hypothetical protein JHK85_006391 [Glycine max]